MPAVSPAPRFPALRSPDFRNLWIGQIISAAGSQMQFAALNWQIYELTHNAVYLGLIGLVRVVPIVLFSLLAGTVADAHDRRRLMLITQSVLAGVALALALLTYWGRAGVAAIYLLTAVGAAAVAFDSPARQALVPSLVPREHLPNAFALNSTGMQVASICGPTIAGFVIGRFGVFPAYALNAVSFLAVIVALLGMRYRPDQADLAGAAGVSIEALKEGLRFVWQTPILVQIMTLDFLATFFSSATALLPIFASDILHVGAEGYGVLSAAPALGSLLAGATMTVLPPVTRQGRTLIWAVFAYGLATIGFGFSRVFALSLLFLAGTGASDTVSTILRQTIRQTITPDRLRGRMVSVNMIFFMGGPQLGELEAGLLARWLGAPFSVISGGVACVLAALLAARLAPSLSRYRIGAVEPRV
jgi:MFS family permease